MSHRVTRRSQHRARSATHMDPTRRNSIMLRTVALIALVCSASATDVSAHARMSEIGKGLMSALSRIEPADDVSNAGRSLLQLDASFCGVMTTQLSCGIVPSASCASTTGCALDSGACELDSTQYDMAEVGLLLADANFVAMTAMTTSCEAKSATQCSADIKCDFEGSCGTGPYVIFWLLDKCPTMATVIAKMFAAEGITQAQVQAEANAAGFTISPEFQAELDAQGVATSVNSSCDYSFLSLLVPSSVTAGCSVSDLCEASTCAAVKCILTDSLYYGDCGAFQIKNSEWCDLCGEPMCCASSDGGCCDADVGAVAGLVIGMVVFLVASITSCAYCCKCCCFRPRPAVLAVAVQQPTFIQQPIPVVAHGTPVQHHTSIQMSSTPPSKETSEQKSTPVKAFCPKCGAAVAGAAFCPSCGQNQ